MHGALRDFELQNVKGAFVRNNHVLDYIWITQYMNNGILFYMLPLQRSLLNPLRKFLFMVIYMMLLINEPLKPIYSESLI